MRHLFLVLFLATLTRAQTPLAGPINNTAGRTTISLNGAWHIIVDPLESGLDAKYYRNHKPKDQSDLVEYDFELSETLNVPGDWNTQREQLLFYEGPVWYRRTFNYQKRPGTRVFVYFGAANYQARVFLNGEKLGEHEGGFTPFNFEATNLLKDGENFLIVEVNNLRRIDTVPTLKFDWWNYGGLTRDVSLVEVPLVFVQDYFVQLARGKQSEIAGWVQLNGATASQQVVIEIPEAHIRETLTTDASGHATFHIPAKLDLWSTEHPKLYDVALSSGGDTIHDQIGFRTIEVQGHKILLNGKPIFLRGVSMHEEAPFRDGRAFSPEDAQTLLGWARDLGCNFVRFAHYPHNENMIREADRLGLMVWSEIPVYWTILWDNPETFENARNQLRESIARDKNKASIILWSVANETPLGEARLSFLKGLIDDARKMDPTRLLTAANERHYADPNTQVIDDPLGEYLDVIGCNEYVGWYDGLPEKADRLQWKINYNKPLIISEFGGDALFGNHGDKGVRWTEEYQNNLYEHQLAMLKKIPSLRGMTPWILTDFRSPRRPLPRIQDFYNRKGLISSRGERKQAFYTLQNFYRDLVKEGK